MFFRIPGLLFDYTGKVTVPKGKDYNPYALLDYIEFIGQNITDYQQLDYHLFYQHRHIRILGTQTIFEDFKNDINDAFSLTGLLYILDKTKQIERVTNTDAQISANLTQIENVEESGLKQLMMDAVRLYKNPRPEIYHTALEKIWDALERIKTICMGSGIDKKASLSELINRISNGQPEYIKLFNTEFQTLTDIGNRFRIRHHEMDKIDITDEHFYEYLFNRCFALVCLALRYI